MPQSPPTIRTLRARAAALTRWAQTPDRAAALAPAREGMRDRFRREVDDGTMTPEQVERCADSALRAHMTRLAIKRWKADQ